MALADGDPTYEELNKVLNMFSDGRADDWSVCYPDWSAMLHPEDMPTIWFNETIYLSHVNGSRVRLFAPIGNYDIRDVARLEKTTRRTVDWIEGPVSIPLGEEVPLPDPTPSPETQEPTSEGAKVYQFTRDKPESGDMRVLLEDTLREVEQGRVSGLSIIISRPDNDEKSPGGTMLRQSWDDPVKHLGALTWATHEVVVKV